MTNPLYEELFEKHRFSEKNFLFLKNQEKILQSSFSYLIEKILNQYKEQGLINQNDIFTDK